MAEPGYVPAEQLRALIKLLGPGELTPNARRMLLAVCTQHEQDQPEVHCDCGRSYVGAECYTHGVS